MWRSRVQVNRAPGQPAPGAAAATASPNRQPRRSPQAQAPHQSAAPTAGDDSGGWAAPGEEADGAPGMAQALWAVRQGITSLAASLEGLEATYGLPQGSSPASPSLSGGSGGAGRPPRPASPQQIGRYIGSASRSPSPPRQGFSQFTQRLIASLEHTVGKLQSLAPAAVQGSSRPGSLLLSPPRSPSPTSNGGGGGLRLLATPAPAAGAQAPEATTPTFTSVVRTLQMSPLVGAAARPLAAALLTPDARGDGDSRNISPRSSPPSAKGGSPSRSPVTGLLMMVVQPQPPAAAGAAACRLPLSPLQLEAVLRQYGEAGGAAAGMPPTPMPEQDKAAALTAVGGPPSVSAAQEEALWSVAGTPHTTTTIVPQVAPWGADGGDGDLLEEPLVPHAVGAVADQQQQQEQQQQQRDAEPAGRDQPPARVRLLAPSALGDMLRGFARARARQEVPPAQPLPSPREGARQQEELERLPMQAAPAACERPAAASTAQHGPIAEVSVHAAGRAAPVTAWPAAPAEIPAVAPVHVPEAPLAGATQQQQHAPSPSTLLVHGQRLQYAQLGHRTMQPSAGRSNINATAAAGPALTPLAAPPAGPLRPAPLSSQPPQPASRLPERRAHHQQAAASSLKALASAQPPAGIAVQVSRPAALDPLRGLAAGQPVGHAAAAAGSSAGSSTIKNIARGAGLHSLPAAAVPADVLVQVCVGRRCMVVVERAIAHSACGG